MKRQWKAVMAVGLAAVFLAGCGGGKIKGAESLTPGTEVSKSEETSLEDHAPEALLEEGISGKSIQEFSYKLMMEGLAKLEQDNPVISPVSAYIALSMAAAGAGGETAQELESLLGEEHRRVSESCMALFQGREQVELELANSAWLDRRLVANEEWLAGIFDVYKGEAYSTDLSSRQAMKAINTWAKDHTRGLVENFLERPLPQDARMALLNALYLKADWWSSFEGIATRKQTWYREDGEEKQVDTMRKGMAYFDYVADEGMDGVVLPFQGEQLVFLAMRPLAGQTVRELYGQLAPEQISDLLEGREEKPMDLSLPKFTVSCDQDLNEWLQGLGVERAFSPELADFSGLGTDEEGQALYISLVRQKALIELNEEGVKAGAVTIVEVRAGAGMPAEEIVEMNLDHPFVYMILDLETQVPLFTGIMDDPG